MREKRCKWTLKFIFASVAVMFLLGIIGIIGTVKTQAAEILDSGTCGKNLTWVIDGEGVLTISGEGNMTDYSSYPPWYYLSSGIKKVVIDKGVTSIGASAFILCENLTSVTIPEGVTSIGTEAFSCCTSLASITVPEGVTSIGWGAFRYCSSLASITIPNSLNTIEGSTFEDCKSLTSITIPSSVTSIKDYAFDGCSGLTSITIPESVTSIGFDTFKDCKSLTSITIPNSVNSIGKYAFDGCSSLTSITIPTSVNSIGYSVFSDCNSLTSIKVDLDNRSYSSRDNCNAIIDTDSGELIAGCKNTVIPEGVMSIGDSAFRGCDGLTDITIPGSVTSIGEWAFSYCSGLTSVTIPTSVNSIGEHAFSGCSRITSITIPEGVTSIKKYSFQYCTRLTSITIPKSVTDIEQIAFYDCVALKDVYYGGTKEERNGIRIGSHNSDLLDATWHYCFSESLFRAYFTSSPVYYNNNLATLSAELCCAAYQTDGESASAGIEQHLKNLGFAQNDIYPVNYSSGKKAFTVAVKPYSDLNNQTGIMVIVVQGSTTPYELIKDATALPRRSDKIGGRWAYDIVEDFYDLICGTMKAVKNKNPYTDYKVLVTGHSLGGAAANLVAAYSPISNFDNTYCYTFGAVNSLAPNELVKHGFENIHNIYNVYDTFSPLECGKYLISGMGKGFGKFGHLDLYVMEHRSTEKKNCNDDRVTILEHVNHDMDKYLTDLLAGRVETFLSRTNHPIEGAGGHDLLNTFSVICCPVNVEVYCDGYLVGRIVDNVVDQDVTTINMFVEGDAKFVFYPVNAKYKLKITATDTGMMSYMTVNGEDSVEIKNSDTVPEDDESGLQVAHNVALEKGKTFIANVTVSSEGSVSSEEDAILYVVDKTEKIVALVTEDGTEELLNTKPESQSSEKATIKKTNPLKVKVTKKTFKRSKLKKAKKFKIGASRAQGKVTYTLDKKAKKAKIKVSKKGIVTVPKKCKKGTYKITVKAAGNSYYKAGSKTVKIIVKK